MSMGVHRVQGLALVSQNMESHMEKKMEHEMETRVCSVVYSAHDVPSP